MSQLIYNDDMRQNDVKSALKSGMITLLGKKEYLDITVTDLVKFSGVARASFYRSYSSIDDVLNDTCDDIKDYIVKTYKPAFSSRDEKSIINVIEFFLKGIKQKTIKLLDVLPENRKYLFLKFEQRMAFYKKLPYETIKERYRAPVDVGIILSVAMTWVYNDFEEDSHELAEFIYSLLIKE